MPGNNDVVDLGGAVFSGQGDVLDEVVTGFIEQEFGGEINHCFPGLTFEPGGFYNRRKNEERYQVPEIIELGR